MNQSLVVNRRWTSRRLTNRRWQIDRWAMVGILLLGWGLRLCCLGTVPPGWRDDALINIHALSGELLRGRFPLYFTGASGHEPLYHWLHAGVHALLGFNALSAHILSGALGMFTIALTFALTRRLFGRAVAISASLALTTSFWSLMYSRTAIRHINLPPLALAVFYLLPVTNLPIYQSPIYQSTNAGKLVAGRLVNWVWVGLFLGASLYTYPAARLLPVLLILLFVYLALFHRQRFKRHWRGAVLALAIAALVSVPMWVAIAQGRGAAAEQSEGIGADSRITELAVPLHELLAGNPRPLLENVWTTLGMFHATGDAEWLYNIAGRPVFNLLGGGLFWAGVALCLYRWRQPRYFFLTLWLVLGLAPTFASIPPASLSHSILIQPLAYILPILPLVEVYRWSKSQITNRKPATCYLPLATCHLLLATFLITNIGRDIYDYFIVWPQQEMVRVLYRADYRDAARYLDTHPEIKNIAVSSTLLGPWDHLALELDVRRKDVGVRLFDPGRVLVWSEAEGASMVLLTSWPHPASPVDLLLETGSESSEVVSPHLTLYTLPAIRPPCSGQGHNFQFANGLELIDACWIAEPALGQEATLLTTWRVAGPLDLPSMPIVANPPPPGVYSGPRLSVFAHLLAADGVPVTGDDGLWVDPLTLKPGDRFIQVHRFGLPPDVSAGPYALRIGLYDPKTGERWPVLDSDGQSIDDHVLIPVEEPAP